MPFTLNAFAWCKKENSKRSVEPHGSTDLSRLTYISVNLCMIKPKTNVLLTKLYEPTGGTIGLSKPSINTKLISLDIIG